MKIKIKNSDLNKESIDSINNLIDMDINVSCAFWLMKVVKEISPLIETKNELEKKITDKYAQRDEKGEYVVPVDNNGDPIEGTIKITDLEAYTKEISDLMNIENELSYDRMNINELGLKTFKTKYLFNLEFLFDM